MRTIGIHWTNEAAKLAFDRLMAEVDAELHQNPSDSKRVDKLLDRAGELQRRHTVPVNVHP